VVEAAELMTSELATNVLRHAQSSFELTIHVTEDQVRVEVRDSGEGQPTLRSPDPHEHSGRGLRIVQALSDAWGVIPTASGKLVWFTLSVHEQAQTHPAESAASPAMTNP
jgi:anti-sigma regulatory factor (Ser/Thr protein kinase)